MLASVDWHLLVLFGGLFVVTGAIGATSLSAQAVSLLQAGGLSFEDPLLLAGLRLRRRRRSTREMRASGDWNLVGLFGGLFWVTGALGATRLGAQAVSLVQAGGISFEDPLLLAGLSLVGSNSVGNVPLVILLLQALPGLSPDALYALALLSTFAATFLVICSIASLLVVERPRRAGDRKRAASGKRVSVRLVTGGPQLLQKKKQ